MVAAVGSRPHAAVSRMHPTRKHAVTRKINELCPPPANTVQHSPRYVATLLPCVVVVGYAECREGRANRCRVVAKETECRR